MLLSGPEINVAVKAVVFEANDWGFQPSDGG